MKKIVLVLLVVMMAVGTAYAGGRKLIGGEWRNDGNYYLIYNDGTTEILELEDTIVTP